MVSGISALLYILHCIKTTVQVNGAFTFFLIGDASVLHVGYSSFRLSYGLLCWLQIAHRIPRFPYLIGFVLDSWDTLSGILSF
jgi:hypothetical protein